MSIVWLFVIGAVLLPGQTILTNHMKIKPAPPLAATV